MKKLNNKGFTLLEVLVSGIIAGMICWACNSFLINIIKQTGKVTKQLSAAQAGLGSKYQVIYFSSTSTCYKVDNYYGKAWSSNTVMLYTDSKCQNQLGTLGALTNDSYFNDVTHTFWIVSCNPGSLRMLIYHLN